MRTARRRRVERPFWVECRLPVVRMGGCCATAIRRRTRRSGCLFALLAPEHEVRREVCGSGFHHAVAEGREIQALEHRLAPSEQDGRKREVQFIDQAGLQILANCRNATANLDVASSRGVACALERGVDTVRDEVERGAALHYDRLAGMVRQDERRSVIGRIVSPPALPAVVQPFPAHRTEHVPPKDEGTEAVHRAVGKGFVHALRATALAEHGLKRLRSEEPAVKFLPALSQRILKTLFRARSEPIQGYRKPRDSDTSHPGLLYCLQQAALLNQCLQAGSTSAALIGELGAAADGNRAGAKRQILTTSMPWPSAYALSGLVTRPRSSSRCGAC